MAPLPGIFLYCSVCQEHRGVPLPGVLLCSSVHQVFDGPASLFSAPNAGMWGERGYGDGYTPYT